MDGLGKFMNDNKKYTPIVTFDFDDTLTETQWDNNDECYKFVGPNKSTLAFLRKHLRDGDVVHIVTSRQGPEMDPDGRVNTGGQPSVAEFLLEHLVDSDRRKIAGVHYVPGPKTDILNELNSSKHYDDDSCVLEALPSSCVGVQVKTLHQLD